jgi:hypothetical protein
MGGRRRWHARTPLQLSLCHREHKCARQSDEHSRPYCSLRGRNPGFKTMQPGHHELLAVVTRHRSLFKCRRHKLCLHRASWHTQPEFPQIVPLFVSQDMVGALAIQSRTSRLRHRSPMLASGPRTDGRAALLIIRTTLAAAHKK